MNTQWENHANKCRLIMQIMQLKIEFGKLDATYFIGRPFRQVHVHKSEHAVVYKIFMEAK